MASVFKGVGFACLAGLSLLVCPPPGFAASFPKEGPTPPPRPADVAPVAPESPAPSEPARLDSDASPAATAAIPLPPPRPADLDRLAALPRPADVGAPEGPRPEAPSPCEGLLASGRVEGKIVPPVHGAGGCGIDAPIELSAIVLADGGRIPIQPTALMRCTLAGALADWVRDDLSALVQKTGGKIARIHTAAAYVCRGRNRIAGAMMSEHGLGNAFDMRSIDLADGREISISKSENWRPFMTEMKSSVCGRFRTILGPGSDGYHEDHVHLDLRERRNPKPFCQWTLK